jgi:hypothetical protein
VSDSTVRTTSSAPGGIQIDTYAAGAAPVGERPYARLGWDRVGEIPLFAGAVDGTLTSTTPFTKRLI